LLPVALPITFAVLGFGGGCYVPFALKEACCRDSCDFGDKCFDIFLGVSTFALGFMVALLSAVLFFVLGVAVGAILIVPAQISMIFMLFRIMYWWRKRKQVI